MDRFIAVICFGGVLAPARLKSNMDRFIVLKCTSQSNLGAFKIQYG